MVIIVNAGRFVKFYHGMGIMGAKGVMDIRSVEGVGKMLAYSPTGIFDY